MESFDGRIVLNPVTLFRYLSDAVKMFWAAIRGKYPVPKRSVVWGVIFMIYFLLPIDLIPELVFSILGFADELVFLVFVLNKIKADIDAYRVFASEEKIRKEIKGRKKNEKTV